MVGRPPDVLVIGAGAAGIFAAIAAAEQGARVLVLEKTSRIGTKILISGGGKCNIAHDGPLESVIGAFSKPEAIFLRPSCYGMPNRRIIEMFTDMGMELYTRPDGRVFPSSGDAKDVVRLLISKLSHLHVQICLNAAVTEVVARDGRVGGVALQSPVATQPARNPKPTGEFGANALLRQVLNHSTGVEQGWEGPNFIECEHVVVACGGSSYPNSGTTGDGWKWTRNLGHSIVKPRAALAPIYLRQPLVHLAGVSLPGVRLAGRKEGKRFTEESGDLLFTHQGLSGPVVLKISRAIALALEDGLVTLEIDLIPECTVTQISEKIAAAGAKSPSLSLVRWFEEFVPHRVAEQLVGASHLPRNPLMSTVGKKSAIKLSEWLKAFSLGEVRAVPLERGEVVAGGIALPEVDSKTMRSRLVQGLYLAGEALDVAGPVGGYNLQAAFATGARAGETAALDALGSHAGPG
jgi:predicted flavoprotein YhiN